MLEEVDKVACPDCQFKDVYGATDYHTFGGVELCSRCREVWRSYLESFVDRAVKAFPEIESFIRRET